MPTFPTEKTQTTDSGQTIKLDGGIPFLVHSINSAYLLSSGWVHFDKNTYYKDGFKIQYNGYQWRLGEELITFIEELEQKLNDKK